MQKLFQVAIVIVILIIFPSCQKNNNDLSVQGKKVAQLISSAAVNEAATQQTPAAITIDAHSVRGCPTPDDCHFTASGAINDEGTIETESLFWTAVPSPVVGTAHWVRSFIGQHGSITIQVQVFLHATDVPYLAQEYEHWIILSGTGDYQSLQGEGDATGIRNFEESKLDVVYTGLVH